MRCESRIALVTGGSRGTGRATGLALAREGANVTVNYLERAEAAQEVIDLIQAEGRQAIAAQEDVGSHGDVERLAAATKEQFGRIHILIANAAVGQYKLIVNTTDEEWDRVHAVNTTGTFYLVRAVLPVMMGQRYGRIITMSSVTAKMGHGYRARATYAASKAAVIALTMGVAKEAASYNITANCICPGLWSSWPRTLLATSRGRASTLTEVL